ncbi:melatonin receptor type 1B-A-like [Acanthaster planci]|uniref:Melatonin receptor type 1B-A-like n=1 Tax=Acanthaster planci TaxID=133434 RepID=A0A8B7Y9V0_ACAPL|nr:melatonin receptor type 1B-A-like [Acanthaster planci]
MDNTTNFSDLGNSTPGTMVLSTSERVGVSVMYLVILILSIGGNGGLIVAVTRSKSLQTRDNAFVVCLSVANLMTGLSLPWSVVGLLSSEGWPLTTEVPCQLAGHCLIISFGANLYSLAGIAINRVLIIVASPSTYQEWWTPAKVAVMVTVAWVLPFLTVLIPPLLSVGTVGYDENDHTCSFVGRDQNGHGYQLALTMVFYPIPIVSIIVSYVVIFVTIQHNFRHQKKQCAAAPSQPCDFSWGAGRESRKSHVKRQELHITLNLFINVCVVFLLNLPYGIALVLPDHHRVVLFSSLVFLMHSFVHPILYGFRHPQFNRAFRRMLHLTRGPRSPIGSAQQHSLQIPSITQL